MSETTSASAQSLTPPSDGSLAYIQRSWVNDFVTDGASASAESEDEELFVALP